MFWASPGARSRDACIDEACECCNINARINVVRTEGLASGGITKGTILGGVRICCRSVKPQLGLLMEGGHEKRPFEESKTAMELFSSAAHILTFIW